MSRKQAFIKTIIIFFLTEMNFGRTQNRETTVSIGDLDFDKKNVKKSKTVYTP